MNDVWTVSLPKVVQRREDVAQPVQTPFGKAFLPPLWIDPQPVQKLLGELAALANAYHG